MDGSLEERDSVTVLGKSSKCSLSIVAKVHMYVHIFISTSKCYVCGVRHSIATHLWVHVLILLCMYICMYVCMYVRTYACRYWPSLVSSSWWGMRSVVLLCP